MATGVAGYHHCHVWRECPGTVRDGGGPASSLVISNVNGVAAHCEANETYFSQTTGRLWAWGRVTHVFRVVLETVFVTSSAFAFRVHALPVSLLAVPAVTYSYAPLGPLFLSDHFS
jgi:hypothetical protein